MKIFEKKSLDEKCEKNKKTKGSPLVIGGKTFDFENKTYVMGILNITPDSFSDGGSYSSVEEALKRSREMVEEGAHIIDIGGESSRPGAQHVSEEEELLRVLPVIKRLVQEIDIPISIDTYKSGVAKACIEAGAHIINDISGMKGDPDMANTAARLKVPCILMHMRGTSKTMQNNPTYDNLMGELVKELGESLEIALEAGVVKENIILDPGIGFGKTSEHNLEILKGLKKVASMGYPILVGASRKRFIGEILGATADNRLEGSLAVAAISAWEGASILRVHDVEETVKLLKVLDAVKNLEI